MLLNIFFFHNYIYLTYGIPVRITKHFPVVLPNNMPNAYQVSDVLRSTV